MRTLIVVLAFWSVPAQALLSRCGDEDVLGHVERMIRESYYGYENRPLEIYAATTEDWDFFLGNYDCKAILRLADTEREIRFEYIIRRSAEDWTKEVLTVQHIDGL